MLRYIAEAFIGYERRIIYRGKSEQQAHKRALAFALRESQNVGSVVSADVTYERLGTAGLLHSYYAFNGRQAYPCKNGWAFDA